MSKDQSGQKIIKLIGRRIMFFRKEQKMGRRLLATKSGLYKKQISSYEKGKKSIAADHLLAISKALDVDIISLFPSFVNNKDTSDSSISYMIKKLKCFKKIG